MLPWANFEYMPIGYGPIWSGQLKLWATWKSGPFWPLLRKSGRATGQAAPPIPTPLLYNLPWLLINNILKDIISFDKYVGWWLITLHSTITWLTLTRSLDGSNGQIKTLTLYFGTYHNTLTKTLTVTITQTLTLTRNLTFFLIWPCHVMSRDQSSVLPITCQGSILTLRHVGWFGINVQKCVDLT